MTTTHSPSLPTSTHASLKRLRSPLSIYTTTGRPIDASSGGGGGRAPPPRAPAAPSGGGGDDSAPSALGGGPQLAGIFAGVGMPTLKKTGGRGVETGEFEHEHERHERGLASAAGRWGKGC